MVQIIEEIRKPSFKQQLGGILGGAMRDLPRQFVEGMRAKKERKALERLGISPDIRSSEGQKFAQALQLEKAKKQYESDLYRQFMRDRDEEEDLIQAPQFDMAPERYENLHDSLEKAERDIQRNEEPVSPVIESARPVKPSRKISGFEFAPNELPKKTRKIPAIDKLAPAAKMQRQEMQENRKEINEFAKPFKNIEELKQNKHFAQEAKELIDSGRISPGFVRSVAMVLSEGKAGHVLGEKLQKLVTNADEQKLQALMMRFARPKDLGGSNPSTTEVLLALQRYPDILNSPEANKFLIDEMVRQADIDLKKGQLIAGLRKYDPYMDSSTFEELVNDKIGTYAESLPTPRSVDEKYTPKKRIGAFRASENLLHQGL